MERKNLYNLIALISLLISFALVLAKREGLATPFAAVGILIYIAMKRWENEN